MTATSTVANAFNDAFYEAAKGMFAADPQVLVSDGHPGIEVNDDMILFLGVTSDQDPANLSASNRSRNETLTLDVFISSFRNGEIENDRVPKARVYELLGQLENYVRTTNTTLGVDGLLWCFLTHHESQGSTDPEVLGRGRMVDCVARFTAQARITN